MQMSRKVTLVGVTLRDAKGGQWMARKPDTPCTVCRKLLWSGTGSAPADVRVCRACRRARRTGTASTTKDRAPSVPTAADRPAAG